MNEIDMARKTRDRAHRALARRVWGSKLSIEVQVTWPPGLLGMICGALLLLCPAVIVMLAAKIGSWMGDRV